MNILDTLQFMKNDIKVSIWQESPEKNIGRKADVIIQNKYVVYNEAENFKPTSEEILAVDQSLVKSYIQERDYALKHASAQTTGNYFKNSNPDK